MADIDDEVEMFTSPMPSSRDKKTKVGKVRKFSKSFLEHFRNEVNKGGDGEWKNDGRAKAYQHAHEYETDDDVPDGEREEGLTNHFNEQTIQHGKELFCCAISSDNKCAYTGDSLGRIKVTDLETGDEEKNLEKAHGNRIWKLVVSPDNGFVLTCSSTGKEVNVWESEFLKPLQTLEGHTDSVFCLCVSSSSNLIASGGKDNCVCVYERKSEALLWETKRVLEHHENTVYAVMFSRNDELLATASRDETINVYDVSADLNHLHKLRGHTGFVWSLSFSPLDSGRVCSASLDKTIRVWNTKKGKLVKTVAKAHGNEPVNIVAYSPNSKIIVSGGNDSNVKVWDSNSINLLLTFGNLHTSDVRDLSFTTDSMFLLSASTDQTAKLTDVACFSSDAFCELMEGLSKLSSLSGLKVDDVEVVDNAIETLAEEGVLFDAMMTLPRGGQARKASTLLSSVWKITRATHEAIVAGLKIRDYDNAIKLYKAIRSAVNRMRRSMNEEYFLSLVKTDNESEEYKKEYRHTLEFKDLYERMLKDPIFKRSSSVAHTISEDLKLIIEVGDGVLAGPHHHQYHCVVTKIYARAPLIREPSVRRLDNREERERDGSVWVDRDAKYGMKVIAGARKGAMFEFSRDELNILERAPLREEKAIVLRDKAIDAVDDYRYIFDAKAFPCSDDIFTAFRAHSTKVIEEKILGSIDLNFPLDLFNWLQFLRSYHPSTYVGDFTLLLTCCWSLVTEAHTQKVRENEDNEIFVALSASIKNFCHDLHENRYLLPEIMQVSKKNELQKLASTGIFRAALVETSARLRIMTVYKSEVAIFCFHMLVFAYTNYHFKFASHERVLYGDIGLSLVNCLFAFAFLLREYYSYSTMKTRNLSKNYTDDFWNYIDCLASISVFAVNGCYFITGQGWIFNYFASISGVLMWLKFLGLIKAVSREIATFVMMLTTIFHEMRSFMFVLGCVIFGFGQAIFMILSGTGGSSYDCEQDNEVICGIGEYESIDNESKFATVRSSLETLYMMMLGDFSPEQFREEQFPLFLGFLFMFIVVVIMLNVLIAIISDSYDAAIARSEELFWRAKFELITEVSTTFESFFIWMTLNKRRLQLGVARAKNAVDTFHDTLIAVLNLLFVGKSKIGKFIRVLFFFVSVVVLVIIVFLVVFVLLPLKFLLNKVAYVAEKNGDDSKKWNLVDVDFSALRGGKGRVLDMSNRIAENTKLEGDRVEASVKKEVEVVKKEVDFVNKEVGELKSFVEKKVKSEMHDLRVEVKTIKNDFNNLNDKIDLLLKLVKGEE